MAENTSQGIQQQQPLFGLLTALLGICFSLLLLYLFLPLLHIQDLNENLFYICFSLICLIGSLLHFFLVRSSPVGEIGLRSIRQTALLIIVGYLVFSLFDAGKWPLCLIPGFLNIGGVLAVSLAAAIDYSFRYLLFSRQTLYALIAEDSHESLMERFARQQEIVFEAFQSVQAQRQAATFLLILGILVVMILNYVGIIAMAITLTTLVFVGACFGLISLANTYSEEHRFFLFGTATPFRFQRIRQDWAYAVIAICLVLACLVAGNKAPLDAAMIGAFFVWVISLFPSSTKPTPEDLARLAQALAPAGSNFTEPASPQLPGLVLLWLPVLFTILKWLAIIAIINGILWFLIKPLFDKGFRPLLSLASFWQRIMAYFKDNLDRLSRFFAGIINFIKVHLRSLPKNPGNELSRQEYLDRLIKAGASVGHPNSRQIHHPSMLIYAEFLDWALSLGLRLHLADTPGDVAKNTLKLIKTELEPEDQTALISAVVELTNLLEQDLFSLRRLESIELQVMRQDCNLLKISRKRAASS